MNPLLVLGVALALASCQSDPLCRARNAPGFIPSSERYRTMNAEERRADAERFNALARRCGWEP